MKTAVGEDNGFPSLSHYVERPAEQQIPKILHFVWVGDEAKRPNECIDSWRKNHPDWEIRVWGNDDYNKMHWRLKDHMQNMWDYELNGVADMMRYEILFQHGGIALDADSISIKPLPEWILECEAVAATENGLFKNPLIACGFQGSKPGNGFYERLIQNLESRKDALFTSFLGFRRKRIAAWKCVGPRYFTRMYQEESYANLTILPGHFFYPVVGKAGYSYDGGGPVYAYQLWGSTFSTY